MIIYSIQFINFINSIVEKALYFMESLSNRFVATNYSAMRINLLLHEWLLMGFKLKPDYLCLITSLKGL